MSVSRRWQTGIVSLVVLVLCLAVGVSSSFASEPWWGLSMNARPSNLPPGGVGEVVVTAENYGDGSADGTRHPITVVDQLPEGLQATDVVADEPFGNKPARVECAPVQLDAVSDVYR